MKSMTSDLAPTEPAMLRNEDVHEPVADCWPSAIEVFFVWRRREGVEPSVRLAPDHAVLKTGRTTGPHPSPEHLTDSGMRGFLEPTRDTTAACKATW